MHEGPVAASAAQRDATPDQPRQRTVGAEEPLLPVLRIISELTSRAHELRPREAPSSHLQRSERQKLAALRVEVRLLQLYDRGAPYLEASSAPTQLLSVLVNGVHVFCSEKLPPLEREPPFPPLNDKEER